MALSDEMQWLLSTILSLFGLGILLHFLGAPRQYELSLNRLKSNIDAEVANMSGSRTRKSELLAQLYQLLRTSVDTEKGFFGSAISGLSDFSKSLPGNASVSLLLADIQARMPQIAATQQFATISQSLVQAEAIETGNIRAVNTMIAEYNTRVSSFPSGFLARIVGHRPMSYVQT